MKIKEIPITTFDAYAKSHPLGSFHQTSNYALLMAEQDYDYDCIALVDDSDNILAASLILIKKLGLFTKYGYAPRGFLIDYYNKNILTIFTNLLKEYYDKKKVAFIKINPEIAIGEIDTKHGFMVSYNQNRIVSEALLSLDYVKIKKSTNFETKLPMFNAILPLKGFDFSKISKNTRNKTKNALRKGLKFEIGSRDDIDILFNFIKDKKTKEKLYYKEIFNAFSKNSMIDVFLVKINWQEYLISSKYSYEQELIRNNELIEEIANSSNPVLINKKIESDKALSAYHDNMIAASNGVASNTKEVYIAGSITIKYNNRINIFISGYDKRYASYNPNYFLHYMMFEHYKHDYDFIDLNGISGDFSPNNTYYGLNKFKIGFNPKIYEFIGEFDLVINPNAYANFLGSVKMFNKMNK